MLAATYVLPLRWADTRATAEMTRYLDRLAGQLDVIVVDGSPLEVFEHHAEQWGHLVKHVPPDRDLRFVNGKVNGVTTGVRASGHRAVVVADDDIRFDAGSLRRTVELLADHQMVIAQSYFDPTPLHALWDEARILLNRAVGVHFPAAIGIDRDLFMKIGGYDGDLLFENLELMRSMRFAGARTAAPTDLFVRHLAPESSAFWSQRVRQAYDDFTLPHRMALWLSLAPLMMRARGRSLLIGAAASIGVAELGRRRGGGGRVYPVAASLLAPAWLVERAICSWIAVFHLVVNDGVPYRDGVVKRAATPPGQLRRRIEQRLAHPDPRP